MENLPCESTDCNILILQLNDNNSHKEIPVHLLVDSCQTNDQCQNPQQNKREGSIPGNLSTTPAVCYDVEQNQIYFSNTAESPELPLKPTTTLQKKRPKKGCSAQKADNDNTTLREHRIINNIHIIDKVVPPRAIAVLPVELQLRYGVISPRRTLPARTRFGPVQGLEHIITHERAEEFVKDMSHVRQPIFLSNKTTESVMHIDASDKDKSNWLTLLKVGDDNTANVWLYEENGELYGMTIHAIPSRTPFALGYSLQYAEEFGIPPGLPVVDLHEVCKQWCFECRIAEKRPVPSQIRKIFMGKRNPEKKTVPHYRCKYCLKTFRRLFTLKRHMRLICSKKIEAIKTPVRDTTTSVQLNDSINTSYMDDCRVPSDESLNNFTNILDFPTNLFDTDRINLDISGSSRSENEFNSHNEAGGKESVNVKDNKKTTEETDVILTTCPYCYQVVVKERYRQHFRTCPKRVSKCVCGQVFNNKQSLINHIHKEHPDKLKQTTQNSNDKSNKIFEKYKCNECKHSFKRRGMLVNHLWRIHNKEPVSVPLERPVKHYPCGVEHCPKIYRTKAKRDHHVAKHHPGCRVKVNAIEEAPRPVSPAACTSCPRQYATRAKLLQHVRRQHADMHQIMGCSTPQPQSTSVT